MARTGNANSATGTPKENADDLAGANGVALKNTRDRALGTASGVSTHPTGGGLGPLIATESSAPDAPIWATSRTTGPTSTTCSGIRSATAADAG